MIKRIYPIDQFEKYFIPFSAHNVEYKGVRYQTAEHAYHCQRYVDPAILSEIQDARSAYIAWQLSQKYKSKQVSDFDAQKVEIMKEICRAKVEQHEDVKEALIESGTDVIIKNYPDEFWGIGMDGSGQNWMGKIWMQLREEIK